jgi:hypothetical protein
MQVPRFSPRISLIEMAPRLAPRSGCPGRPALALPCPCPVTNTQTHRHTDMFALIYRTSGYPWRSDTIHPCLQARIAAFCSQDLSFKTSIFGSQNLGFRTSIFGSQDLGFRTSIFGSQDLGFRTSKNGHWVSLPGPGALHPTVVLSFSRHFSLRPSSFFSASSGHRQG